MDQTSKMTYWPAVLAAAVLGFSACNRDNGLPRELLSHLSAKGITVTPIRQHAPLSSRGGYVTARHNSQLAGSVIAAFKLQRIDPGDRRAAQVVNRAGIAASPKELWGVAGRPTELRLKNGAQFEFLYLVVTADGLMYLVAEYAYG